jgi:hypothetical protein
MLLNYLAYVASYIVLVGAKRILINDIDGCEFGSKDSELGSVSSIGNGYVTKCNHQANLHGEFFVVQVEFDSENQM